MKEDYTHVSIILDRTGSMESIRDDTIGGFNVFLDEQRQQPGSATLTLVQFDTQNPYEIVHQFKPIQEIPELTRQTFVPRASTPLLDALGRGINDLDKCLTEMDETQRPSKVILVIITDGQENSSREFRNDQIIKMIQQKQKQDGWQFVFLSADLASIGDAQAYGFKAASSMTYDKTGKGVSAAWSSLSLKIGDYRKAKVLDIEFTKEDRDKQESEHERKK